MPLPAFSAPVGCDSRVTVTPTTIPAGTRGARVRVPSSLTDVHLHASSGTVGGPVSEGPMAVVAEYEAGLEAWSSAIVAAVGGNLCGFTVVHITGASDALRGRAGGATLLAVHPQSFPADGEGEVAVYVFAIDERGAPRRGNRPAIQPSIGTVEGLKAIAPGVWRGAWRVPAGEATAAAVSARFPGETASATVLARIPGAPASIEIAYDVPPADAPDPNPTAVLVRLRDAAGNLTEATPEVDSDTAVMGVPVRQERGVYRVPFVIPPTSRVDSMVVIGRADRVVVSKTLPVAATAIAAVRVKPPGRILADGKARALLEVAVVDAQDRPLDRTPVGSGGRGQFGEAWSFGPGQWFLPYRPAQVALDSTEEVVVTAGQASTSVKLELMARRLSFSLGGKAGASFVGGGVGPSVGVEGGAWTLFGRTQLGLVLGVDWWMVTSKDSTTIGGAAATYQSTRNYLPLVLSVAWRTAIAERWMLWATAGGGGGWISNSVQVAGQPTVSETGFVPAISGSLSAGPRLGPGFLFLEARVTWTGDPKLSTLSGSSTTFLGLLGYRFDVG